jgi:hypothetical protein
VDEGVQRSRALDLRIARLPHRLQVAFAAGCAERALAVLEYEEFPGGPHFLPAFRAAVEAVWAAALDSALPPNRLAAAGDALAALFPEGDHYAGYHGTVGAGCAVLAAVDAAADPSGRAAADAALHVLSAYEQVTQWDEEPTDEFRWQVQAVELLERWGDRPAGRELFGSLPPPPALGAG